MVAQSAQSGASLGSGDVDDDDDDDDGGGDDDDDDDGVEKVTYLSAVIASARGYRAEARSRMRRRNIFTNHLPAN